MEALTMFMSFYKEIPPVTRFYVTACTITSIAVQLELISPFQLYFNPILIMKNHQYWRLITTFLFFGSPSFNFIFNMIFTIRYCRMLEENSFRGRTADFVVMFIFGFVLMIICAFFFNQLFLGQAFTMMITYVWSRRNPNVRMGLIALLNFNAPYLPWILVAISFLVGGSIAVDLLGIAVGHAYYFLEDVFPNQTGGWRVLKTPSFLEALFNPLNEDPNYNPLPQERPGGFNWGNAQEAANERQQPPVNENHPHQD